MNTIGHTFKVTLFGSSHGEAVGCVLDGVPPGLTIDIGAVQREVDLRKPSEGIGTPRREADGVEIISGMRDGRPRGHRSPSSSVTRTGTATSTSGSRKYRVQATQT